MCLSSPVGGEMVIIINNGKSILSGSEDETIKLWTIKQGKQKKTFFSHTKLIEGLAISKNEKLIVSGSWDCTVKIWCL